MGVNEQRKIILRHEIEVKECRSMEDCACVCMRASVCVHMCVVNGTAMLRNRTGCVHCLGPQTMNIKQKRRKSSQGTVTLHRKVISITHK